MSDSCTLSSEAEKQICKSEMKNAAWNLLPGIGPPIGNSLQGLTDYENKLNKQLGDAKGKLDQSVNAWRQDITQLTGEIATDLRNLVYLLIGNDQTGQKSIIEQMIQTDIFPLEKVIGYLIVVVISVVILLFNMYV